MSEVSGIFSFYTYWRESQWRLCPETFYKHCLWYTLCIWPTVPFRMWSRSKSTVLLCNMSTKMPVYSCVRADALAVLQCMKFVPYYQLGCMCCLHVSLVSEPRGAWASGAAGNLSPGCQGAFKVFSSCSSGCSQPRPHPRVSCRYVTVPAGPTEGTHGDSDRRWMIQGGRTEGMRYFGRSRKEERKKENDGRAERGRLSSARVVNVLFHCRLENKENIELVDIQAWS